MKTNYSEMTAYHCDLCRRPVDLETDSRARRGWQPLVVCERCVREAQTSGRTDRLAA
jgi:DNA-directed RNA polymerase subunit RPC12/RpoP